MMQFLSCPVRFACIRAASSPNSLSARRNTLNLLGLTSGLDLAAKPRQCLPAGVARTLIALTDLTVAIRTAALTKSFAIRLAQCSNRQGQKHLLPQNIFKQQTVL